MPELAERFGAAMGEANDLIGHLPVKSDQFFVGFTSGIIGQLLPGLQKIDNYDFTQLGLSVGTALATAFESISDGTAWTIFKFNALSAIAEINADLASSLNLGSFSKNLSADFKRSADIYKTAADAASAMLDARVKAASDQAASTIETKDRSSTIAEAVQAALTSQAVTATMNGPSIRQSMTDTRQASAQVNEYQRRGLSLGGIPDGKRLDQQIELTKEMRDFLKIISEAKGRQLWA